MIEVITMIAITLLSLWLTNTAFKTKYVVLNAQPSITLDTIGYVTEVRLIVDEDYYTSGDLVIVGGVPLIIKNRARVFGSGFYHIAFPIYNITRHSFNLIRPGAKISRLDRELTNEEKVYISQHKIDKDQKMDTSDGDLFCRPYTPSEMDPFRPAAISHDDGWMDSGDSDGGDD